MDERTPDSARSGQARRPWWAPWRQPSSGKVSHRGAGGRMRGRWVPGQQGDAPKPTPGYRPKRTETARLSRLDPDHPDYRQRKRKPVRNTIDWLIVRWRYFATIVIANLVLMTVVMAAASVAVATRDSGDPNKVPSQKALSALQVEASIRLGDQFIASLFKALPGGEATQSEAKGLPLTAFFPKENQRVLLGEEPSCPAPPSGTNCHPATSLVATFTGINDEGEQATFDSSAHAKALSLSITVNWAYQPTKWQLNIVANALEPAVLYLDRVKLADLVPGASTHISRVFANSDQSLLRQLRFTERHATQEAYLYYASPANGNNRTRAAALGKFLRDNGYIPGFDLRAPLFGVTAGLPDDMPDNLAAYPDCNHIARSDPYAYAYHSKVCLFPQTYIVSGERDPFLQAWLALTVLQKYHDPNHPIPGGPWYLGGTWWTQGSTPLQVARHLQGQWNVHGDGIPKCTPYACQEDSGIRTAVFCALETLLGYQYGDQQAKYFADAAATVLTRAQVKQDGLIHSGTATYYRPSQVGAYYEGWSNDGATYVAPYTPRVVNTLAFLTSHVIHTVFFWMKKPLPGTDEPTPAEYLGVLAGNSETALDALGALQLYLSLRYHIRSPTG